MLPFKLIYHEHYDLNLGAHVFPSQKYRLIHDALLAEGIASSSDFLTPEPATDEDVQRVHSREYVHKLKTGHLSLAEKLRMEIPYSQEMIEACWLAAGGSIWLVPMGCPLSSNSIGPPLSLAPSEKVQL